MSPFLEIFVLVVIVLGVVVFFVFQSQSNKNNERELYKAFLKLIAGNIQQNLDKLDKGDVGWRRLGHGQATIGLKKIAPRKADVVPVSLETVENNHPQLVKDIKDIDADIGRTQAAADRLASSLEAHVRQQFLSDREKLQDVNDSEVKQFKKWLTDREDAWMEMLANLVNNAQTLKESSDPGTLYWQYSKDHYIKILEKHGGDELEDLNRLKSRIIKKSKGLLAEIRKIRSE